MISQSYQDPFSSIDENEISGKAYYFENKYVPYSPQSKIKTRPESPKDNDTKILVRERKPIDTFLGAKRAFMASHARKSKVSQEILNKTWVNQERLRKWNYQQEMKFVESKKAIHSPEYIRRQSRSLALSSGIKVATTTGPQTHIKLPRDVQNTEYPKNHIYFWG